MDTCNFCNKPKYVQFLNNKGLMINYCIKCWEAKDKK